MQKCPSAVKALFFLVSSKENEGTIKISVFIYSCGPLFYLKIIIARIYLHHLLIYTLGKTNLFPTGKKKKNLNT